MEESIREFAKQFLYVPEIVNREKLAPRYDRFIFCGMGGSHLAADLISMWHPELPITVHSDYGLPPVGESERPRTLVIACSYSGNTEESVDAFETARRTGMDVAVVATGEKLLALAKKEDVPYIVLPKTGIQPRMATGLMVAAFSVLLSKDDIVRGVSSLAQTLDTAAYEASGRRIAEELRGHVPVVYASAKNGALAKLWKIKLNETGKIPAFHNVVPELNHNEMTGFDTRDSTKALSAQFHFILLKDPADDPRVRRRMEVLERLYRDRGLSVTSVPFETVDIYHRTFASLLTADWTAYHLARIYGVDPEQVPMVEEFKRQIANSQ